MWVLPINDDEFLAWSRFQVGLAVTTGVLVIVITTAAVILLGRAQAPGTALPPRSPSASASKATPSPTPSPSAVPSETAASPTAKVSASKKPSATPALVTLSISCDPAIVPTNEATNCVLTLSSALPSSVTISVVCSFTDVVVPTSVTINAGEKTASFGVLTGQTVGEATITVTMPGNGAKTFNISIFQKQSVLRDLSPILRLTI